MFLKDVLRKCEEKGYKTSATNLYAIGKKYGFIKKGQKDGSLDIDKSKFLKWLNKAVEKAPEGWLTIKELAKLKNISMSFAYMLVNDEDVEVRRFGAGQGVAYVNPEGIDEIIQHYKNRHTYEWDEQDE